MPLNPGDLLFVGCDSDNDDIAFVVTTDIAGGEVIYFTDDEWDGSAFNGGEQYMEWTVPAGGITQGTVVTIDMDRGADTATIDAGGGFDYMRGGYDIAGGNEMFWAFQGTRTGQFATPTNFIAVIGNEADGNNNQTPNLSGTGLTPSNGALIIDGDEDYMEYTGDGSLPDPVERDDLIASVLDPSNWTTADGGGNQNPGGGFDVMLPSVVCFTAGSRIATPEGPRPVESLAAGDLVTTRDHGAQPLRWTGHRRVLALGRFAPVEVAAGALGNTRAFRVSPQHRLLLTGWRAELLFGEAEVLVPAKALVNDHTIRRMPGGYVDYIHILFDRHEIVEVEGCPAESLYPGDGAAAALAPEARAELLALFPELTGGDPQPTARPLVSSHLARAMIPGRRQP